LNLLIGTWSINRQIYKRTLVATNADLTGVPDAPDSKLGIVVGGYRWFEYYSFNEDFTYQNICIISGADELTSPNGKTTITGHYRISGDTITLIPIEEKFESSVAKEKDRLYKKNSSDITTYPFKVIDNSQTLIFEGMAPFSTFYRS
jgi:hypothetical protein